MAGVASLRSRIAALDAMTAELNQAHQQLEI